MNIIILGPQGSGKGTQAELLVNKFGLIYLEMGKTLRSIANSDNPRAEKVREFLTKGELVPDEFVRLIAWDHINKSDREKGFIFDGYPRSVEQYLHVEDMLKKFGKRIDKVIFIQISEEESIKRLSARRTCGKCGEIFNLITKQPQIPEVCDRCGGSLVQRADDTPEAIKKRLALYRTKTQPILELARQNGIALEVDGERAIEEIHDEIMEKINK